MFEAYFHLGWDHIVSWVAVDHLVFILTLTLQKNWSHWRSLALLATAFTLGHSITLALATLQWVAFDSSIIEFLIPTTIALSCFLHGIQRIPKGLLYGLTAVFGLVHGLGFSNFLRQTLGAEESLIWPLFSFNIGLEAGQLVVLTFLVVAKSLIARKWNEKKTDTYINGMCLGMALLLMLQTKFW